MVWARSSTLRTKLSLVRFWTRAPCLSRMTTGILTSRASTLRVGAVATGVLSLSAAGVDGAGWVLAAGVRRTGPWAALPSTRNRRAPNEAVRGIAWILITRR